MVARWVDNMEVKFGKKMATKKNGQRLVAKKY
jgi:hypothetical protein